MKDSGEDDFSKAIWKYIIEEKENNTPDSEILSGLKERGLDEPQAALMLTGIAEKLTEMIDHFDTKKLSGGLAFTIGLLVTLFTLSSARITGGYFILAWGAIIFGAVRFFSGHSGKKKYTRLLKNIESNEHPVNSAS